MVAARQGQVEPPMAQSKREAPPSQEQLEMLLSDVQDDIYNAQAMAEVASSYARNSESGDGCGEHLARLMEVLANYLQGIVEKANPHNALNLTGGATR
jgi:hypothetical protein